MNILLAVDGSPYTKRMLGYLAAHSEWLGDTNEFTVMTVTPALPKGAVSAMTRELVQGYYDDEAERVLKSIRVFLNRHGLKTRYISKVGQAAPELIKQSKVGNHDLIMMGSHGHGTLTNLVMGSVATKVLAGSEVPVLLVR